jgi:alcohol dehydrogenase YqhD (iron-dependent ADH family)
MNNFTCWNPTKIVFGKDTLGALGEELASRGISRVLLVYGKGSIFKNGVHEKVTASLKAKGILWEDLGGIQANPLLEPVRKGIEIFREKNLEAIVPVGGGSVYDTAKAIAAGVAYAPGDVWDLFGDRVPVPEGAPPIFGVLTTSATGTEMNRNAVITNESEKLKWAIHSDRVYPVLSILDPSLQESLPPEQTARGVVDTIAHTLEVYFDGTRGVELMQEYGESLVRSALRNGRILMKDPANYNARAELAWASTLALNDSTKAGKSNGDWASHALEHSLSALYNVAHGTGLAIVMPAWMRYVCPEHPDLFARFAEKVFGITGGSEEERGMAGIEALKKAFLELGEPVTLEAIGVKAADIPDLVANCFAGREEDATYGRLKPLTRKDVQAIFELALQ